MKNYSLLPRTQKRLAERAEKAEGKPQDNPVAGPEPAELLLLSAALSKAPARAAALIDSMRPSLTEAERRTLDDASELSRRCGPEKLKVLARCMKRRSAAEQLERMERIGTLIRSVRSGDTSALLPMLLKNSPMGGMAGMLSALGSMQNGGDVQNIARMLMNANGK